MEKQYNYTIIIPHYKIIDLLGRALNSIPDREDIQILVVDDNSGIEKCKFEKLNNFQKANCKFIFTYKSGGAGYVRNEGLTRALGKWLLFLDADDFFEKNAFNIFDEQYIWNLSYLGNGHPKHIMLLNNLGLLSSDIGNYVEAEQYYIEALTRKQEIVSFDLDYAFRLFSSANLQFMDILF